MYLYKNYKICLEHKFKEKTSLYSIYNRNYTGYKYILSIKKQFIEFLKCFINEQWIDNVTEDNIEQIDKEFILNNFSNKESDIIYKINLPDNEFYFVLIELQSKVDYKMPFRVFEYMFEIWRKVSINTPQKNNVTFHLPIIIPCVLYNGKTKWNAAINFSNLFKNSAEITDLIPTFNYIFIDIKHLNDNMLLNLSNVLSCIFFIDKSKSEWEIHRRLEIILKNVQSLNTDEQQIFTNWLLHIIAKDSNEVSEISQKILNKEDTNMHALEEMMPKIRARWEREAKNIGKAEGIKEGIKEGVREGKIILLKKLLTKKFNCPPQTTFEKIIEIATIEKIELLEEHVFDISTWEEAIDLLD